MSDAERVEIMRSALEFYAQKPEPDTTSVFAQSAAEWGEGVTTWEPLLDMGDRAREALAACKVVAHNEDALGVANKEV